MPPTTITCLACARPFPRTGELAAIPDAAMIAFEPVHQRVWRVCAHCGEWNLLGAEASAAALPELEVRFAAAPRRRSDSRLVPARIGKDVELLRVGVAATVAFDEVGGVARRRWLERWRTIGIVVGALMAVTLVADLFWSYRSHVFARVLAELLWLFPLVALSTDVPAIRHKVPLDRRKVVILAGLFAAGVVIGLIIAPSALLGMIPAVAIVALVGWFSPPIRELAWSGGSIDFFHGGQLRAVTISWTEGGTDLVLHDLPGGRSIEGPEVPSLIRQMDAIGVFGLSRLTFSWPRDVEAAHHLVRSGGLRGLLRALDGFRRDRDGRVVIYDLPRVYRLALDFALASDEILPFTGSPELHARAAEAVAIATVAQDLESGQHEAGG